MAEVEGGGIIATKEKRKTAGRVIISAAAIAIIIALTYFLFFSKMTTTPSGRPSPLTNNININDVNAVIHNGTAYTTVQENKIVQFAGILRASGYIAASVSNFNASNVSYGDAYPISISSSIIEAANGSDANAIMLTSVNAASTEPNITSSQPTAFTYQYNGVAVPISTVLTIYNVREPSIKNQSLYPEYQYTSSFSYGDYAGIVVVSGYSTMSPYTSQSFAEILLQSTINYYGNS